MRKKPIVFVERRKLDNALYNLIRYINLLKTVFLCVFLLTFVIGFLFGYIGLVNNSSDFMRNGIIIISIAASVYLFFIKPAFLIMYAIVKILSNLEKKE